MKKYLLLLTLLFTIVLNAGVLYVLNSSSETLSRIDLETGEVDNAFASLGSMPNRFVCTNDHIYVVNSGDNSIQKIDAATGQTLLNIFLETSSNPYDLTICDDYLYVTGGLTNQVYKIDLMTDELVDQIAVGVNPAGLTAMNGKLYVGNTNYMGNYSACSISVIDLDEFIVINTIPTAANPQYLLSDENYLHISCTGNWSDVMGSIQIMELSSYEIIHTISMDGYCFDMTKTTDGIIYVGDAMNSAVYAYDAASWDVIYDPASPFTPGGSVVEANSENLVILGGEWGQNFTVNVYDTSENYIAGYQVGLYGTDMKFQPEATPINDNDIITTTHVSVYPNPFSSQITFSVPDTRSEIMSITIYDIKGRVIKEFISAETPTWDGRNHNGQSMPSGIYFSRLLTADKKIYNTKILKMN